MVPGIVCITCGNILTAEIAEKILGQLLFSNRFISASTAADASLGRGIPFSQEGGVGLRRRRYVITVQVASIRGFVEDLAQGSDQDSGASSDEAGDSLSG